MFTLETYKETNVWTTLEDLEMEIYTISGIVITETETNGSYSEPQLLCNILHLFPKDGSTSFMQMDYASLPKIPTEDSFKEHAEAQTNCCGPLKNSLMD